MSVDRAAPGRGPALIPATGVVLAGGRSRRMGRDKWALRLGRETMLARTVRVLASLTDEVLVVGLPNAATSPGNAVRLPDAYPDIGPLAGLLSGLRAAAHERALVVACDLPALDPLVLKRIAELGEGCEAAVPRVDGHPQPLHALYSKTAIPVIEEQIAGGELSLRRALDRLRVRWIDEGELRPLDPELRSFVNVNTPDDWKAAVRRSSTSGPVCRLDRAPAGGADE